MHPFKAAFKFSKGSVAADLVSCAQPVLEMLEGGALSDGW